MRLGLRIGSKARTPADFSIRQDENDLTRGLRPRRRRRGVWRFRCNRILVARFPDRRGLLDRAAGQLQGRRWLAAWSHPARPPATGRNRRTQTASVWEEPLDSATVEMRLFPTFPLQLTSFHRTGAPPHDASTLWCSSPPRI